MITNQDRAFSLIEDILFNYYQRRFSDKKTFDTVLLTEAILKSGLVTIGNITVFDGKYQCISEEQWSDVIDIFWAKRMKWVAEEWDCDKFAIEFKSLCNKLGINSVGIMIGDRNGSHAFNCYVNSNLEVFVIEPQTGKRVKVVKGEAIIIDGQTYTGSTVIL